MTRHLHDSASDPYALCKARLRAMLGGEPEEDEDDGFCPVCGPMCICPDEDAADFEPCAGEFCQDPVCTYNQCDDPDCETC